MQMITKVCRKRELSRARSRARRRKLESQALELEKGKQWGRKAPPMNARYVRVGTTRIGCDGRKYCVGLTCRGTHYWFLT